MVFFSSCASVQYHQELLNFIDLPVLSIHVSWIIINKWKSKFRANKSSKNEHAHSFNFVRPKWAFCYVRMWLPADWTFPPLIGLFRYQI